MDKKEELEYFIVILLADPVTKRDLSVVTRSFFNFYGRELWAGPMYLLSDEAAFDLGHSHPHNDQEVRRQRLDKYNVQTTVLNNVENFLSQADKCLIVFSSNMPLPLKNKLSELCGKYARIFRFSSGTDSYKKEYEELMKK